VGVYHKVDSDVFPQLGHLEQLNGENQGGSIAVVVAQSRYVLWLGPVVLTRLTCTTLHWCPLDSSTLHDPFTLLTVHLPSQCGCKFLAVGTDSQTGSPGLKEHEAVVCRSYCLFCCSAD